MTNWVYRFGLSVGSAGKNCARMLGGKGANLSEMAAIGLPVPPGFIISTEACHMFSDKSSAFHSTLSIEVSEALRDLEECLGAGFGDPERPLLLSVRSGAQVSMPGMMDTVLNLGLNNLTVDGLARHSGDARFAWDSYRRFIQMYADVVLGIDHGLFETALEKAKAEGRASSDAALSVGQLQSLVVLYQAIVVQHTGQAFPQDVEEQLWGAVGAVFASWNSDRAKIYRRINGIADILGTAVTVQAMVFGNKGGTSATGVAFTRNPSTGAPGIFGEFLINAQGEDVVAGIRTPHPLTVAKQQAAGTHNLCLEEAMPLAFRELENACSLLERHYRDMQDIEFTIEEGKLWLLQTRSGKRTIAAALKIAIDLVEEQLIEPNEAVLRIDPAQIDHLLHPTVAPDLEVSPIARGLAASPGAVSGRIALDTCSAEALCAKGDPVILVRAETSPEDIHGMHIATGILTARGGMTSHAAVVARGMGRPCISAVSVLQIDETTRRAHLGEHEFDEGDFITIDGSTGYVYPGQIPTVKGELSEDFMKIMVWADAARRMRVRANADSPEDAETARKLGAEGIGLCRTEHMFFEPARIAAVREMILAGSQQERQCALAKLLPEQRRDFTRIFEAMAGFPVTIRLLDPPLHEFLPQTEAEFDALAQSSGLDVAQLRRRAEELREFNPMLGHRGCRLAVTYPEIYEMQVRAILEAACEVDGEVTPEIMVPLAVSKPELAAMKQLIDRTATDVFAETGKSVEYLVGSMIELPRAALRAGELAEVAAFFSFGTNDLTQTTFGMSRDDSTPFMIDYLRQGLLSRDPFINLDVDGVGELMALACERALKARPSIKLGICGEHGGDPYSINACERMQLDYVSASPFRVPAARLAAAHARLLAGVNVNTEQAA